MKWWQVAAMIAAGFGGAGGQIFVTKAYFYAPAKEISVLTIRRSCFQLLWDFWSWDRSRICLVFADM